MAYDQNAAYHAPRRGYQQLPVRQQYPQDNAYQRQAPQQYDQQRPLAQANYAAEGYGTMDPYAQDAGNPYNDGGHSNDGDYGYNQYSTQPVSQGRAQDFGQYGAHDGGHNQYMNGYTNHTSQLQSYSQNPRPQGSQERPQQAAPGPKQPEYSNGHSQQPGRQHSTQSNAYVQSRHDHAQQQDGYALEHNRAYSQQLKGHAPSASQYSQYPSRPGGYEQAEQPRYQDERRYDPRYQQRSNEQQARPAQNQSANSPPAEKQQVRYAQESGQQRSMAPLQAKGAVQPETAKPKMTMEEWKRQEKAKMHKTAAKPETLAQDNAFPTFPTTKKPESRNGGQSAMSIRSDEHTRPSTASSFRPDDRRPGLVRSGSSQQDMHADSARPSLDQKPYANEPARPSMDSFRVPERVGSPLNPQRTNLSSQGAPPPPRKESYQTAQASPGRSRPMMQPISTNENAQRPEPQPLSPNYTRPTTSDSGLYARRPSESQPLSPLGQFAQSAHEAQVSRSLPPAPSNQKMAYQQHRAQQSTLGDVYDGYYDKRDTMASSRTQKSLTRDEEIEAEMPDFDSAAPLQTSQLHKRNQTVDQHLNAVAVDAPPVPTMPASHSSNASGNFDFGFQAQKGYSQRQYQSEQPLKPPSQPFVMDTQERRSMDDQHQGPSRTLVNGRPPPQRFHGAGEPQRPAMDRQGTTFSDPGMQRVGSVPPRPSTQQSVQSGQTTRNGPSPLSNNPDALPAHPAPVRAGLMNGSAAATPRPAPVRNYGVTPTPQPSSPAPVQIGDKADAPVTHAELSQLRAQLEANPGSSKTALIYAKKLVEASKVLAKEGGRADSKTAAKNRERYLMEAYKRVKKLSSAGYPDAQFYLADCYGQGMLGLEVDAKEAFKLYQAAAKAGHPTAAYRTAVCCEIGADEGGGTSRDYPRAVQWYKRAAALGETAAMFKVGMISLKGLLGQPRHLGEAVVWLKRAAERADKDNPHALHELAVLHETANSTPEIRHKVIPDDVYALSLYRQAAELGAKHSQFRMGQAYEYGQLGLSIDHRSSISWYSKAASQGEHQAELALSGWYLTGAPGILENSDTEAYLWARKAAQAEPPLAKAMFAMGYFVETGIGCPVNVEEAKRWYGRAASYKHPKALERLEALRRGAKGGYKAMPTNSSKLTRKDQKHDEAECIVM